MIFNNFSIKLILSHDNCVLILLPIKSLPNEEIFERHVVLKLVSQLQLKMGSKHNGHVINFVGSGVVKQEALEVCENTIRLWTYVLYRNVSEFSLGRRRNEYRRILRVY